MCQTSEDEVFISQICCSTVRLFRVYKIQLLKNLVIYKIAAFPLVKQIK